MLYILLIPFFLSRALYFGHNLTVKQQLWDGFNSKTWLRLKKLCEKNLLQTHKATCLTVYFAIIFLIKWVIGYSKQTFSLQKVFTERVPRQFIKFVNLNFNRQNRVHQQLCFWQFFILFYNYCSFFWNSTFYVPGICFPNIVLYIQIGLKFLLPKTFLKISKQIDKTIISRNLKN